MKRIIKLQSVATTAAATVGAPSAMRHTRLPGPDFFELSFPSSPFIPRREPFLRIRRGAFEGLVLSRCGGIQEPRRCVAKWKAERLGAPCLPM
jgi:hypothetical protein